MIRVDPATVAADPAAEARTCARAEVEQRLAMLVRLAEMGMQIAEAATAQATGAAPSDADDGPLRGDPVLAYTRVARAVRMTIALLSRLSKELADLDRDEQQARSARAITRKTRLHRRIEQALEAEHPDGDEIEQLSSDAWERLTEAGEDGDLEHLTFAEAVARICNDLRLSPEVTARLLRDSGEALPIATAAGPPTPATGPSDGPAPDRQPTPPRLPPPS